jgi:hypothetical protein
LFCGLKIFSDLLHFGTAHIKGLHSVAEQEAAVVEEDEEMEREEERGVAKRPDLNELDVPECWGCFELSALQALSTKRRLLGSRPDLEARGQERL